LDEDFLPAELSEVSFFLLRPLFELLPDAGGDDTGAGALGTQLSL
jgi:hypothetical protein